MSKGSAPQSPNYSQAASADQAYNAQSAQTATNQAHPNQTSAWGSSEWSYDPTTQQYTQNVSLNPTEQATLEQQQGAQLGAQTGANQFAGSLDSSGLLNPITSQINGAGSYDPQAEAAAWNEYENTNAPIMAQQTSQLETQLADQGLTPGSQAYQTAMQNLEANQNTANSSAASQAYLTGIQGGQAEQGMDINALNANEGEQTQGLNLLNGLLGDTTISNPYANSTAGVYEAAPGENLQAAQDQGQADLNAYNAQTQGQNSLLNGLVSTGLGAAALALL